MQNSMVEKMMGDECIKESLITGGRCFKMFEPKTPEQVVVLRKLEKMLGNLTTLDSYFFINVKLFDLTVKRKLLLNKQVPFLALLLENLQIEANLGMDKDFVKVAGELIAKISPGFDDSPLMGFFELFSEAGMHLEY